MRLLSWVYRVAGGASDAIGESWPLWAIGLLGGALFIGGMVTLIFGAW